MTDYSTGVMPSCPSYPHSSVRTLKDHLIIALTSYSIFRRLPYYPLDHLSLQGNSYWVGYGFRAGFRHFRTGTVPYHLTLQEPTSQAVFRNLLDFIAFRAGDVLRPSRPRSAVDFSSRREFYQVLSTSISTLTEFSSTGMIAKSTSIRLRVHRSMYRHLCCRVTSWTFSTFHQCGV